MRTIALLAALAASALLLLTPRGDAARPAPGPGAVIHMHERLFAAIDSGDVDAALGFLHTDMRMEDEWSKRPCQVFIAEPSGVALGARNHAESRELLARFVKDQKAKGGRVKTEVVPLSTNCYSGELSYGVMELVRTRTEGKQISEERWISTALVTEDGGWKLTHWQLAPAPPAEKKTAQR